MKSDLFGRLFRWRGAGTGGGTRSRRRRKRLYHTLTLAGVGMLFVLIAVLVQPFTGTNLWFTDQLFTSETPSPNIVIVGIDDETLQAYGKWSEWSRSLHAQAIENLSTAGARVIGYDVLFVDESADDAALAGAIEKAGNVVLAMAGIDPLKENGRLVYGGGLEPTDPLWNAAAGVGHVNMYPDQDGKLRRVPLVIFDRFGNPYPGLGVAMLHALFSIPLPSDYSLHQGKVYLAARNIPVDGDYNLRVNFGPGAGRFAYLSYGEVIRGDFDPQIIKNKLVLIGMTATGELDVWSSPLSGGKVPGVLIHALVMDTILRERFLTEAGTGTLWLTLLLLLAIVAFALPQVRLIWGIPLVAVLWIGYLLAVFLEFDSGHILNILYPLSFLPFALVAHLVCSIVIEQSDKRLVRDLFGRYVSPQVAREILTLADSDRLRLGGEAREVSVLFADIRGFTQMSERMAPEQVVGMLNTFLPVIMDKVLANEGMVNKFAGDNIMAVWNAPQSQPDHARLAVKAAWEAQQTIAEMIKNDPSLPPAQFGIGINTGTAVAGNVGSPGRVEYTVIGDSVNLASRICGAAPAGEIWIGPETYRQVADVIEAEEKEPQTFKGKTEKVKVYRVLAYRGKESEG